MSAAHESQPLWPKLAAFVRQHTHDVRNHLNGLDLEAALLSELVTDAEAADSVQRMRCQVRKLAADLRTLSARFADPRPDPTPFALAEFISICEEHAASLSVDLAVDGSPPPDAMVNVDAMAISDVFKELLRNALQFGEGAVALSVEISDDSAKFAFREKCSGDIDPSCWGQSPFASTKRGAYGLGLWEADRTVAANGGSVARRIEEDTTLVTEIFFPLHSDP